MTKHIAHGMAFSDLMGGLRQARDAGLVAERSGPGGLSLYCYTEAAVYDRVWTPHTMAARGLIVDGERIVATPFPKFFNLGERDESVPALEFAAFDKMDGSLIIIFHHAGRWLCATKGSFQSTQAVAAQGMVDRLSGLVPGITYLAELIGPSNRIVARYPSDEMVLLAAYRSDGVEVERDELVRLAVAAGLRLVAVKPFASIMDIASHAKTLPMDEEGFVVRFANGYRLKIKGDEYRRIHALVSRLSPLSVWEAMLNGDDMERIRRDLPEEFWGDFDQMYELLFSAVAEVVDAAQREAEARAGWTDKEVGLALKDVPEPARHFIFAYRKTGGALLHDPRARRGVFMKVRPDANVLPGYAPSFSLNRAQAEAAA